MLRNSIFWYWQICLEVPDLNIFHQKMAENEKSQKASKHVPGTSWVLGECSRVILRLANDSWTIFEKVAFFTIFDWFLVATRVLKCCRGFNWGVLRTFTCARSTGAQRFIGTTAGQIHFKSACVFSENFGTKSWISRGPVVRSWWKAVQLELRPCRLWFWKREV